MLLTIFWTSSPRAGQPVSNQTIRVAIVKQAASVVVGGDGLLAQRESGAAVAITSPVIVRPGAGMVLMDGTGYRKLTCAAAGAVTVNGKPYRGLIEITCSNKGLLVVNELPLEEYLIGLINCEVSSAWPIEAVKAQAVIARTYALYRKNLRHNELYHLESSVLDQVYDGCQIEDSRAHRAVMETSGQVLTYNGAIIQAFYHSSCGGKTESSENVWGMRLPYLKGVNCEYCLESGAGSWEQKLDLTEIENRLHAAGYAKVAGVAAVVPGPLNSRGRLKNVSIASSTGNLTLTGDQFRKAMGYGVIKSTNFSIKVSAGAVYFKGLGNGHGVGLCQWGAKQRALNGFDYTEILSYYYPGTTMETVL